jgi:hypothetical protein
MSKTSPRLAAGPASGAGRTVTLDYLTAAGHPNAMVTGALLLVIGLLVAVGLVGLVTPVLSLELFSPDLSFSDLVRSLGQIAVSVLALVTAGLGLAKHPRFPALFLTVSFGLTVLVSLAVSLALVNAATPLAATANLGAFPVLATLVVLAVPYVAFSRKCRLIFQRRLSLRDLNHMSDGLGADHGWTVGSAPALGPPVLPRPEAARHTPERRPRSRKPAAADASATSGSKPSGGGASLTVPPTPPADANAAALWAALYGPTAQDANRPAGDEAGADSNAGAPGNRRIGLESLINLRPPGAP